MCCHYKILMHNLCIILIVYLLIFSMELEAAASSCMKTKMGVASRWPLIAVYGSRGDSYNFPFLTNEDGWKRGEGHKVKALLRFIKGG